MKVKVLQQSGEVILAVGKVAALCSAASKAGKGYLILRTGRNMVGSMAGLTGEVAEIADPFAWMNKSKLGANIGDKNDRTVGTFHVRHQAVELELAEQTVTPSTR